jgi:serine/threonine protein kinase
VRLGDYEILARLGSGGQGVVYLARSLTAVGHISGAAGQGTAGTGAAGGQVAIKLLHAQMIASKNARARFVRELSLLQRVAGFCTAQVIEADLAGDQPYIVSEYVPGPSLRELVHDQGPRTGADLDRLAISSVTALTAIHRADIVHRDFKPQNVLMGADGPRVIDFGIARALDPSATVTSQIVGTPAYMAPEQFAGAEIGPAADLFAWAATLLFAATGRDPFSGGSVPATMYRIMHHDPDLSPLPDQIASVAADALRKDPTARPSAEEALLRLLGDRTTPHRSPPTQVVPPGHPSRPARTPENGSAGGTANVQTASPWLAPPPQGTRADTGQAGPGREAWTPSNQTLRGPGETAQSRYAQGQAEPQTEHISWAPGPGQGQVPAWGTQAPPGGQGAYGYGPPPGQGAGTGTQGAPPPTGPVPAGWKPVGWSPEPPQGGPAGVREPGPRGVPPARKAKIGIPVAVGLALAALLAALDVLSLAIFVARPDLTSGSGGRWLLVVAASFVFLAVVTLVGVVLAWRGSRPAAWAVLFVRVVRVPLWALLTLIPEVNLSIGAITAYAGMTALLVLLLASGLRSR